MQLHLHQLHRRAGDSADSSPTLAPTVAPTSHQAAVPFFSGPVAVTEVYSNDGTVLVTASVVREVCARLPTDTTMIEVVMGTVHDFFRPIPGYPVCQMLLNRERHELFTGAEWVVPSCAHGKSGGSDPHWPLNHVAHDFRERLSVWGFGGDVDSNALPGGCCSSSYSVRHEGWNQSHTMNAVVTAPAPTHRIANRVRRRPHSTKIRRLALGADLYQHPGSG